MRGDEVTKVKNEKRTKDRTVRNNCCRARHEEEVLVKPETPEVQKHLRPQHTGSTGECKEEGLKTEKTQEAQGSRTDGWMGESKAHRNLPRTWWEAEACLRGHEEGVDGNGVEITDTNNFGWGGELVSLSAGGARKGLLGQKTAKEVSSQWKGQNESYRRQKLFLRG